MEKKIPAGAGLGGGSSDAAHTLLGLNKLCELELSREKLEEIGAKLGADVPFFLWQQPMLVSGTGTELEPFDLEADFSIKLITPPIHSSTAEAYKALDLEMCSRTLSIEELLGLPRSDWKEFLVNDLEEPVFKLFPELNKIKNELYEEGAFYAAMSGSGSSVFGLFSN